MKLYEIEEQIMSCVDLETGEIIDIEKLNALSMERDKKIEGLALWVKNLDAEAKAYKEEKDSFSQKQRVSENKAKSIRQYLSDYLNGNSFKTTRVNVSFRNSSAVEVYDLDELMRLDGCDSYLKHAEPTPNKTAIKEAINNGVEVAGCRIVENRNIQIK